MQRHIQNLGTDPGLLPCEPCTDARIISDMEMNDHSFVPTNELTCLIDPASCFTQGVGELEIQQILSWQKKRVANIFKEHI